MYYKVYIIILLLTLNTSTLFPQNEWIVPEDKKDKLCHYEFDELSVSKGHEKYKANCVSCHGNPTKNNYVKLTPLPGDPASDKFQANTDGELFYKIAEGKGQMPSFNNILSTNDLWDIISYIRSFNKEYIQEVSKKITRRGYDGEVELVLGLGDDGLIRSFVSGKKKGITEPLEGVQVKLMAKRYFGNILIDEVKQTDNRGVVHFNAPNDLPGDSTGAVEIIAQLVDEELYGNVRKDTLLPVGKVVSEVSLVEKRAMWNKMRKAPLWLLISYFTVVTITWAFIIYVIFIIRKIYFLGEADDK